MEVVGFLTAGVTSVTIASLRYARSLREADERELVVVRMELYLKDGYSSQTVRTNEGERGYGVQLQSDLRSSFDLWRAENGIEASSASELLFAALEEGCIDLEWLAKANDKRIGVLEGS